MLTYLQLLIAILPLATNCVAQSSIPGLAVDGRQVIHAGIVTTMTLGTDNITIALSPSQTIVIPLQKNPSCPGRQMNAIVENGCNAACNKCYDDAVTQANNTLLVDCTNWCNTCVPLSTFCYDLCDLTDLATFCRQYSVPCASNACGSFGSKIYQQTCEGLINVQLPGCFNFTQG
jgi:hypothetical protein